MIKAYHRVIFASLQHVLWRVCMIVALAVAGLAGTLQFNLTSTAEAAVVSRIDVEGNQRVDDETVRAYLTIRTGRSYSAEDVDESLKALFETGLFSDVRMAQRTNVLIVTVVENPIIDKVVFEGNKKYKDDQLSGALQSRSRGIYTQSVVQSDTQRLLEFYRRSGRFQASVEPQIINLNANRIILVFVVNEGPETVVARINFIGNQRYSDGKLRDLIATRQTGPFGILNWFRNTDTYDPDRLASDEEKIRRFYLDRGYADIQIISTVADLDIERNIFFVTITIDEGQRYKFGTIEVDSAIPGVDGELLRRKVTAREGAWYSSRRIEESLEEITIELAGSGYAFAQVRPRIDRDDIEGVVHITLIVDEGTRAYVERIEIRGNTRTRDYVIRREIRLAEGDAFNRVLIDQAERRLRGLGYFSEVRITVERGTAQDRVTIIISVTEQPTGEFSFGAGYSSSDGIVGDISITERNFLGRGYAVRLAVGGGDSSRTYEFGWTDPMFMGRPISAGFNIYRKDFEDNDFRNYSSLTTGGGIDLGFPVTENLSFRVGYNIEQQEIDVAGWTPPLGPGNPCPVSTAICSSAGDVLISSASYSLIYDSIDDKRNPREGIYTRFNQKFAGIGGDVNYLRSEARASYYRTLLVDHDIIGFLKVQGAHIVGLSGDSVRLTDSLFRGGESVRGFKSSGFGPRDSTTGDALGGTIFFGGTAEIQFPIPILPREIGIKGAVFADAGTLYDTEAASNGVPAANILDSNSVRSSVGGSILWASPLGPIRADYAYILSSESYDREQAFRIGGQSKF